MFKSTRAWLRKNRTPLAIGAAAIGGAYLTGQYVLGKISEARQRMRDESIAKENLRRRFTQNQEDCLYTTLALLPTATDNILRALPVEDILAELQARKNDKISRGAISAAGSEIAPTESVAGTEDERDRDRGSVSASGYVHASRDLGEAVSSTGDTESSSGGGALEAEREKTARALSGRSKVQLWEDLKIQSITRAVTLLYVLPLLTLLTRIQLNLLGRRTYLSSVVSLASPYQQPATQQHNGGPPSPISLENHDDDREDYYGNDFETNRKYLTFSWWLLHRGWNSIRGCVDDAVRDVFGTLNPRDNVPFEKLAGLILEVRKRVEGRDDEERREKRWLEYLLPPRDEEEGVLRESGMLDGAESPISGMGVGASGVHVDLPDTMPAINATLRRLLNETSDLIDSPAFSHVLTLLLDSTFSLLVDGKVAAEAYKIPTTQHGASSSAYAESDQRVVDVTDQLDTSPTARLVTILAVFQRQAAVIGRGGEESMAAAGGMSSLGFAGGESSGISDANEYLAAIEQVRDLEAFAAVVYSSNFEFEGLNDDETPAASAGPQERTLQSSREIETSLVEVGAEVEGKLESAWDKATGGSP